jgi:hypothetical protein
VTAWLLVGGVEFFGPALTGLRQHVGPDFGDEVNFVGANQGRLGADRRPNRHQRAIFGDPDCVGDLSYGRRTMHRHGGDDVVCR